MTKVLKAKSFESKENKEFNLFVSEYFGDKYDSKNLRTKLIKAIFSNIPSFEDYDNPLFNVLPNAILDVIEIPEFMTGTDSMYESLMAMINDNTEMINELYNLVKTWPELKSELVKFEQKIIDLKDTEDDEPKKTKKSCSKKVTKNVEKKATKKVEIKKDNEVSFSKDDFLNELHLLYTNNYCIVYNSNTVDHYLRFKGKVKKYETIIEYKTLISNRTNNKKDPKYINLKSVINVLSSSQAKKVLSMMPIKLRLQLNIIDNLPLYDFDIYITDNHIVLELIYTCEDSDEEDSDKKESEDEDSDEEDSDKKESEDEDSDEDE
jgi:hypothetical protein